MNEFIVWDNKNKQFVKSENYGDSFYLQDNGVLYIEEYNEPKSDFFKAEENIYKIFKHIGKKDINNKKIYIDSSIVEFEYWNRETVSMNRGYFFYDEESMEFQIDILTGHEQSGKYNFIDLVNIKVIDTIQENKLGLIK